MDGLRASYTRGLAALRAGDLAMAETAFRAVVAADGSLREAHHNLGVALARQGRTAEASAAYEAALALDPRYLKPLLELAALSYRSGAHEQARALYRRALALDPASPIAQHLLAALEGHDTAGCPDAYVTWVFDACAADYERVVAALDYRAPASLAALLDQAAPERRFARAVDLGCGTGLFGRALRARCAHLLGVDLSPAMLLRARAAGCYDELEQADLASVLAREPGRFELVAACDVFAYLGDLAPTFAAAAAALAPDGLFAFTVEDAGGAERFVLRPSGRYAHGAFELDRLAEGQQLRVVARRRETLRHEGAEPVFGHLLVLGRQGPSNARRVGSAAHSLHEPA